MKKAVGEERYSPAVVLRKYSIYLVSIGTPLSNSITELHTMMRYLEYDFLKDHGLQHFDNWVSVVTHPKGQPFIADKFPRHSAEVRGFCCLREAC